MLFEPRPKLRPVLAKVKVATSEAAEVDSIVVGTYNLLFKSVSPNRIVDSVFKVAPPNQVARAIKLIIKIMPLFYALTK